MTTQYLTPRAADDRREWKAVSVEHRPGDPPRYTSRHFFETAEEARAFAADLEAGMGQEEDVVFVAIVGRRQSGDVEFA